MAVYSVPECNLADLTARVEKLNRRARRLNVAEITFAARPDHVRYEVTQLTTGQVIGAPMTNRCWRRSLEKDPNPGAAYLANAFSPTGRAMQWYAVEVNGAAPTLNGWSFVAVLEPVAVDGATLNIIQTLPGERCPEQYRAIIGRCDHCRATRRRNQTFVVRHDDGRTCCVGRQCIKDFLGYHADPEQLAAIAEMLAELGAACGQAEDEDGFGYGSFAPQSWNLTHFLTLAACRIRSFGWMSRTAARDSFGSKKATADVVLTLLTPPTSTSTEARREWDELTAAHVQTPADAAEAEAAQEWAAALPPAALEDDNYLANLNVVARMGLATRKTAGLAASLITAYQRATEKEVNRQRAAARPPSAHVGTIGKRLTLTITCEKIIKSEGAYGLTGIHKMTDAAGNDLVWFASEGTAWLTEGKTYKVKATPKKHDAYKDRPQTTVNRLTIVEELTPATTPQ